MEKNSNHSQRQARSHSASRHSAAHPQARVAHGAQSQAANNPRARHAKQGQSTMQSAQLQTTRQMQRPAVQGTTPMRASRARLARESRQNGVTSPSYVPDTHSAYVHDNSDYERGQAYGSSGGYFEGAEGDPSASGDHGKPNKKKMSKGKKIALSIVGALVVVLLGVGGALAWWVSGVGNSMGFEDETQMNDLQDALATANKDEAFYMLVLGSDALGDETSRSDVIMLSRIDPATGTVHLVSIPRDTMVTIEGYGTQKINAAYAYGGPALAVKTVSEFAGVPISHYAEVHFDELESLVDTLGGVTVNVPQGFSVGYGGISFSTGEQTLSGKEALAFARDRTHVAGGDFGRAQAQRLVAEAIIKEVLATPATELPGVIGEAAGCVSTDMGLTDIIDLALSVQGKGLTLYSAACPSYTKNVNGVSYVCTMFDEWKTMMQLVDAGLDPEDTSVAIPAEQQQNEKLGAATNSPAPRDYQAAAAGAMTTDDVVKAD